MTGSKNWKHNELQKERRRWVLLLHPVWGIPVALGYAPWHPLHPHHRFDGQSSDVSQLGQQMSGSHLPVGWSQEFITHRYTRLKIPGNKKKKARSVPTWAFGNFLPEDRSALVSAALKRLTLVQSAPWRDGLPLETVPVRGLTQLQEGLLERLHRNETWMKDRSICFPSRSQMQKRWVSGCLKMAAGAGMMPSCLSLLCPLKG